MGLFIVPLVLIYPFFLPFELAADAFEKVKETVVNILSFFVS